MALVDKVCKHNMTDYEGWTWRVPESGARLYVGRTITARNDGVFTNFKTVTKRRLYSRVVRIASQEQREHQQISKCFDIYCSVRVFVLSGANSGNYANYSIGDCGVCCLGLLLAAGENTAGR